MVQFEQRISLNIEEKYILPPKWELNKPLSEGEVESQLLLSLEFMRPKLLGA